MHVKTGFDDDAVQAFAEPEMVASFIVALLYVIENPTVQYVLDYKVTVVKEGAVSTNVTQDWA